MTTRQRNLLLILARDLASSLATPMFIVDVQGDVLYYNEAAGEVLGRPFVEAEPMPRDEWATTFRPTDEEGRQVGFAELPLGIALEQRKPAHRALSIRGAGGAERRIEVTAFPLYARADEFVGGIAIFWEKPEEA